MSLITAVYVGIPVLTVVVNLGIAYWIGTRQDDVRGSRWYVAYLCLASLWMVFVVVQYSFVNETVRRMASSMGTKFAVLSFVAWVVFAARYSHTDFHRRTVVRLTLWATVAVALFPSFLPGFDSMFHKSIQYPTEPFPYVIIEPSALYGLVALAVAFLTFYALYHFVLYMFRTPGRSGPQLLALVLGVFGEELVATLGNLGAFPVDGVFYTAYGVLPGTVFTTIALFHFRLFETQPRARNAIVENLEDPVVVIDSDRRVVDYNRASLDLWPSLDESIGDSVEEACPRLTGSVVTDGGMTDAAEQVSVTVDGRRRHYSITVSPVGSEDAETASVYAVLLRDVTDLERSRWQLERQNEHLDQVAGTISHDLRNPIDAAQGYETLLEDVFADDEPDDESVALAREYIAKMDRNHDRMLDIVSDVLTIAREGKSVEETEPVDLDVAARSAWENVDTGTATLSIAANTTLQADRSKLLTVFENLFRNAVEHGPDEVHVEVGPTDDGFYVQDDGPGIDGHREQVFEYGYSTSSGTTGLGLSIVRTMVESHGWTVDVDESYTDGARFVVSTLTAARSRDDERAKREAETT